MRSIVFRTKGKLDLRSLTVFGLNAKVSSHPIGYFGTGLKYAIAVIAREELPVTFYIGGKKWTVECDATTFRNKKFKSLSLKRHTLIPKTINLPFTTELGKNWDVWQAFRELESNTRDEKGDTFIHNTEGPEHDSDGPVEWHAGPEFTMIVVEGEQFVEAYMDRHKTFLKDGLTKRDDSTGDIEVFALPSEHIYYRGIRVIDLKEDERSEVTYNILRTIDLTEDRTAADIWTVKYYIAQHVAQLKDKGLIEQIVMAPKKSFEASLALQYHAPSVEFLDTVQELSKDNPDNVLQEAKDRVRQYREPPTKVEAPWKDELITALEDGDWDKVQDICTAYRDDVVKILKEAKVYEEPKGDVITEEFKATFDEDVSDHIPF